MAEAPKKQSPPYATYGSFVSFINNLRETGIPSRIDPTVFGNASGSIVYSLLSALKFLNLTEAGGKPTQRLIELVSAADEERRPILEKVLRTGYPTLFSGAIDLKTATAGQLDEHIRDTFEARGSTIDKIAVFFLAAAQAAGIEISPQLKARRPVAASSASKKSGKQRKREDDGGAADNGSARSQTPSAPPPPPPAAKRLEYQLIDLLKESDVQDEHQQAIWTLVRWLGSRKPAADTISGGSA